MTAVRASAVLLGGLLSVAGGELRAADGELLVSAPIVAVDPIRDPLAEPADGCRMSRPAPGSHLLDLLAWDLRAACDRRHAVTGYRVSYQWDGRTYHRLMDHPPPGDHIALRVRVR